eukprot:817054-Prorocentrum_minimum.AAC.5
MSRTRGFRSPRYRYNIIIHSYLLFVLRTARARASLRPLRVWKALDTLAALRAASPACAAKPLCAASAEVECTARSAATATGPPLKAGAASLRTAHVTRYDLVGDVHRPQQDLAHFVTVLQHFAVHVQRQLLLIVDIASVKGSENQTGRSKRKGAIERGSTEAMRYKELPGSKSRLDPATLPRLVCPHKTYPPRPPPYPPQFRFCPSLATAAPAPPGGRPPWPRRRTRRRAESARPAGDPPPPAAPCAGPPPAGGALSIASPEGGVGRANLRHDDAPGGDNSDCPVEKPLDQALTSLSNKAPKDTTTGYLTRGGR